MCDCTSTSSWIRLYRNSNPFRRKMRKSGSPIDPDNAGRKAREFLDAGGETPIIGSLDEAPGAKTLVMGIAPPGGRIPDAWRAVLFEAIDKGMDILSGLHDFISDDRS